MKYWYPKPPDVWRCMALGVSVAALAAASEAPGTAEDLASRVNALGSFRVQFVQRTSTQEGETLEIAEGSLVFAVPDRIRWQVNEPSPQVIVSDGRQAAVLDPDLQQLVVHDVGTTGLSIADILASTPEMLLEHYSISRNADEFILVPLSESEVHSEVWLRFSAGALASVTLIDKLGTTTQFEFSSLEPLVSVDPDVFLLKVPEGTDIVGDASKFIRP